jgi:hypothetical protein
MIRPEKFSDYLSIFAVIVSSTSLLISFLNYRRQGGILKFGLDYEKKGATGVFVLRVENAGYHSVKVNQIRMVVRDSSYVVDSDGFIVEYGPPKIIRIPLAGYKDFHPIEVSRIEVVDIANKPHKISTKGLRHKVRQ